MFKKIPKYTRRLLRRIKPQQAKELELIDSAPLRSRNHIIPPVVYLLGESRVVTEPLIRSHLAFRKANEDLGFRVIDARSRDTIMLQDWSQHPIFDVFTNSIFGEVKNDIFRYCHLFRNGGYMFDISAGMRCGLSALHDSSSQAVVLATDDIATIVPDNVEGLTSAFPINVFATWGMGFTPRHPFLAEVINRIVEISPFFMDKPVSSPARAISIFTGQLMFTQEYREFTRHEPESRTTELSINSENCTFREKRGFHAPLPRLIDSANQSLLTHPESPIGISVGEP